MEQPRPAHDVVRRARWTLVGLILVLAAGAVAYRLLVFGHLNQSAALFIGLPAFLAVLLTLSLRPRGAAGLVFAGLTLAILMAGSLLGEGFICLLMASPLLYFVAGLVVLVIRLVDGRTRRRDPGNQPPGPGLTSLALLPFLVLSLEGVHPNLSFPRNEQVTAQRVLPASSASVEQALARSLSLEPELPLFFQLGFPRPVSSAERDLSLAVGES